MTITFLSLADVRPVPRPVVPYGKRSFGSRSAVLTASPCLRGPLAVLPRPSTSLSAVVAKDRSERARRARSRIAENIEVVKIYCRPSEVFDLLIALCTIEF